MDNNPQPDNVDNVHSPTNPLLEKVHIPGETFQLPSRGIFYTNGELSNDVIDGEVYVKPMTTIDELIMKSPDKLLQGTAIDEVFAHCIPQILKPRQMLAKDVDYLLICLRKLSFGEHVDISYTHDCDDAKDNSYSVELNRFIRDARKMDPTTLESKYTITLPNEQEVKLAPPSFAEVITLYGMINSEETDTKILNDQMIDLVLGIIKSVDGITDRNMILEWLGSVPAGYVHTISKVVEESTDWGPDLEINLNCKDCGAEIQVNMPLNPVSFFT